MWKWLEERWSFFLVAAIFYGMAATVFYLMWANDKFAYIAEDGSKLRLWAWVWIALVALYTLSGITGTGENDRALKMLLGLQPVQEVAPQKVCLVLPGLITLRNISVAIRNIELPGEPEQVWRLKDENDEELPLGIGKHGKPIDPPEKTKTVNGQTVTVKLPWVQPIRTPFAANDPPEEKDPLVTELRDADNRSWPGLPPFKPVALYLTDDKGKPITITVQGETTPLPTEDPFIKRVTTETSLVVNWRPWGLKTFLRVMGDYENAEKIISDVAVSEMNSALQVGTLARMLANQELLSLYLLKKIRERLGHRTKYVVQNDRGEITATHWDHPKGETCECRRGVEIVIVQLKAPNLSHDLNKAVQAILEDRARALALIRKTEGDRQRMELLNEFAETAGGRMMLELERLKTIQESVGKPGDKIVLVSADNPTAAIFGAVGAGQAMLSRPTTTPPPPPPGT